MKRIFILTLLLLLMAGVSAETINISEMSIESKIAQMFIIRGDIYYADYIEMGIGGYFLDDGDTPEYYKILTKKYSESEIRPFFSTDLEGAWNPFVDFFDSKTFEEIETPEEAYELGVNHSKILNELGFNMDFSPVVETNNEVWPARSFSGNESEVKKKIAGYILGLEENGIIATAKHYPGGSMIKNPHIFRVKVKEADLEPEMFDVAIKNNVSAIMIGHTIVGSAQSTVSRSRIIELRNNFSGLIITDDITMQGLMNSYIFRKKKMMKDLIWAGNDIILWTGMVKAYRPTPKDVQKSIDYLAKLVSSGEISEERIDMSVRKILEYKGYNVVS